MLYRATSHGHGLGWRRDTPDFRDHMFRGALPMPALEAPRRLSLRDDPANPPIYDQGRIGSCTANAVARLEQFVRRKHGQAPDEMPSRLFLYYDVRAAEHTIPYDAGAELRDVLKTVAYYGVCSETEWPYDDTPANPVTGLFPHGCRAVTHPPKANYQEARHHVPTEYLRIPQMISQMKVCLLQGYPFVFGFTVYSSLYGADGMPAVDVPMPSPHDEMEGGHAVCCMGYDDDRPMPGNLKGAFLVANSWGPELQDGGYFWLPYSYLSDAQLASDLWTIRSVKS